LRWRVQTGDECDDQGDECGVGKQQEGGEVERPPVCRAGWLLSHRRRHQQRNTDASKLGLTGRSEQLRVHRPRSRPFAAHLESSSPWAVAIQHASSSSTNIFDRIQARRRKNFIDFDGHFRLHPPGSQHLILIRVPWPGAGSFSFSEFAKDSRKARPEASS
jgi:hypothetical protein